MERWLYRRRSNHGPSLHEGDESHRRTGCLSMAYVDLVSTGVTPVVGGATYNFAFDTPVAADGSPHITHLGFQSSMTFGLLPAVTTTLGRLISNIRIKVGSMELVNFDDPEFDPAAAGIPSNLSVLAQKVGGTDAQTLTGLTLLSELSLPFGLDASKSHRVNMSITLGDEAVWAGQPLIPASTEFNIVHYYGRSAEQTLYGSRQDFDLNLNATRTVTIYGKQGWNMLGVVACDDSLADALSAIRVNNGAFRELTAAQWRILDGTYKNGIRNDAVGVSPAWTLFKSGFQFLDLKRITAGANVDLAVTAALTTTCSFFPVWVAPLGAKSGAAPKQTTQTVSSVTGTVNSESAY